MKDTTQRITHLEYWGFTSQNITNFGQNKKGNWLIRWLAHMAMQSDF